MRFINRYSPKENLAYLIVASENVKIVEFNELIAELYKLLKEVKNKTELLDKVDVTLLNEVNNYWMLKKSQVMAYGYLVFNHFKTSTEFMTLKTLAKNFNYQMRFYSPDNAVEFVQRQFNVDLEVLDNE